MFLKSIAVLPLVLLCTLHGSTFAQSTPSPDPKKIKEAFKELKSARDEFSHCTRYFSRKTDLKTLEEGETVTFSIQIMDNGARNLELIFVHLDNPAHGDFITVEGYKLLVGTEVFEFKNPRITGNGTHKIICKLLNNDLLYKIAKKMTENDQVVLRVYGSRTVDYHFTRHDFKQVKAIVNAWEALTSKSTPF